MIEPFVGTLPTFVSYGFFAAWKNQCDDGETLDFAVEGYFDGRRKSSLSAGLDGRNLPRTVLTVASDFSRVCSRSGFAIEKGF
jgi:hypothetical protein